VNICVLKAYVQVERVRQHAHCCILRSH